MAELGVPVEDAATGGRGFAIINMLNSNTNLLGTLLSHYGWSGDTATGRRGFTSQGYRFIIFDFYTNNVHQFYPKIL